MASGKIWGMTLNFASLRREVTDGHVQDYVEAFVEAWCRDATVNSLLYNVKAKRVVDPTGLGLPDLDSGIMRTPLSPCLTFMVDPLRVMRFIRIATQLRFTIDAIALDCMKHQDVQRVLGYEVARERIGAEVLKMMQDKHAADAFRLIVQTNLYHPVFMPAHPAISQYLEGSSSHTLWLKGWLQVISVVEGLLKSSNSLALLLCKEEDAWHVWPIAAWTSYARLWREGISGTEKEAPAAICAPPELKERFRDALTNYSEIRRVVRGVTEAPWLRGKVGMALRFWGASWSIQLVFALLLDAMCVPSPQVMARELSPDSRDCVMTVNVLLHVYVVEKYIKFADFVVENDLGAADSTCAR